MSDPTARERHDTATSALGGGAPSSVLALLGPILDHVDHGMTVVDARSDDLPLVYVNPTFERLTGYAAIEVLGTNCRFLQGPNSEPEPLAEIRRAIRDRTPCDVVLRNYRKDGTPFWNRVRLTPMLDPLGALTHIVGLQKDVTAELTGRVQQAERETIEWEIEQKSESVQQMEARLLPMETVRGEVPFGVILTDASGAVTYLNPAAGDILGFTSEDALGQPLFDLIQSEPLDRAFPLTHGVREKRIECWLTLSDGDLVEVGVTIQRAPGTPTRDATHLLLFRKLEEVRQARNEVRQLKRLSSLGELAAGFAHQVRNPLAAIRALSESLVEEMDGQDARRELPERTLALVERIEALVQRALRFTNAEGPVARAVTPAKLVDDAIEVLAPRWKEAGSRPTIQVPEALPPVWVDPAQIVEVITTLLENALDAVRGDVGQVALRAAIDPDARPNQRSKRFVTLEVHDHGPGISIEHRERIFQPFFTTKPRGTGLGLPIALRLTHDNGGLLRLRSSPSKGTTFCLMLPICNPKAQ